jgi:hypothetical protein
MTRSSLPSTSLNRRRFVQGAATAAAGLLRPHPLTAQGGPWAQRPAGNPQKLTFVVWQYGKIYEQIAKQFEDDWGIKLNQIIEPNVEPIRPPVSCAASPSTWRASWAGGSTCPSSSCPTRRQAR